MYKCKSCGHLFEEGEQRIWAEESGEFVGCPVCSSSFEKTKECKLCGSVHLEDELNGGVCDECIEPYANDIDMCFKISCETTKKVKLNAFIAELFDEGEIEQILLNVAKEEKKKDICLTFIDEDKGWFGEKLVEVLENEK